MLPGVGDASVCKADVHHGRSPCEIEKQRMGEKQKKGEKRTVLLKGEGENRHVLYGDSVVSRGTSFRSVRMKADGLLRHEDPEGRHAEHWSLRIRKGEWVMGMQVEFDPFSRVSPPFSEPFDDPSEDGRIVPVWD